MGQEDPLGKETATHSNILAWEIPWSEEPGGLPNMGLKRAGHNLVTNQQQHIQRKMHRVYEDFGNEKSLAHIKETSRCIFTIVKLFPKLFMRLKHSKDYFLNVSVLENVKRAKHVSCVSNQLSLSDSF